MKILIAVLFVFAFANYSASQSKSKPPQYKFPESGSEFTVTFPSKPNIENMYTNETSALSAELPLTAHSFVRAEWMKRTPEQMKSIQEADDETLTQIPLSYAKNIALDDPVVKTGIGRFGKYVKLRGYKKLGDLQLSYEVYFYFGSREIIGLYAAAPSKEYPTAAILTFLNSLETR